MLFRSRKLVSMLSSNGSALLGAKVKNLFAAASMGWTKCYNISTLQKFIDIVDSADGIDGNKRFAEIPSYEDFVDVICFAIKGVKITGSEKSVVHYRQHGDSITSSITEISFKEYRTNFLHYLEYAEDAGKYLNVLDESTAREIVSSFVRFKLWVIMGIIDAKKDSLNEYSSTNFITDYISGGKFAKHYGDEYSKDNLEKFYGDVLNYFKGL